MTPAASATRTLRAPRRLPHGPAAWERARTVVPGDDVTSQVHARSAHIVLGSQAADFVHASTAPALVIPAPDEPAPEEGV